MSRWKAKDIEPRLSTIERLQEALAELKAESVASL
jgi:predicted transcriptional regulator